MVDTSLIINKILWTKNARKDFVKETALQIQAHKDQLGYEEILRIIEGLNHDPHVIKAIIASNCLASENLLALLKKTNFNFDFVDQATDYINDSSLLTQVFISLYRESAHQASRILRKVKRHLTDKDRLLIIGATNANPTICQIL